MNLDSLNRLNYYLLIAIILTLFYLTWKNIITNYFGGFQSSLFTSNRLLLLTLLLILYSDNIFSLIIVSTFENMYIYSHYFYFALVLALFIITKKFNLYRDINSLRDKLLKSKCYFIKKSPF